MPKVDEKQIPVAEYVKGELSPISHLAHNWELHSATLLTPAEERVMVREPAGAVPDTVAKRLNPLRVLLVPYVACSAEGDLVSFSKPAGDTHSAVWVEREDRTHLVLPCRELDAHDTGFELLASVAELLQPKLHPEELDRYADVLEEEIKLGIRSEIDEEATAAKHAMRSRGVLRRRSSIDFEAYRDVSFVSTLAEYIHGLWHDVEIRVGDDHLPVPQLRRRMKLMAEMFPPNEGYEVFARDLQQSEPESS
ncbi:MAG TPA: hypothetical protein VGW33_06695 [Terriglobia bacterium]|nr:hypothetical protein [Terriglobia bacterium]